MDELEFTEAESNMQDLVQEYQVRTAGHCAVGSANVKLVSSNTKKQAWMSKSAASSAITAVR